MGSATRDGNMFATQATRRPLAGRLGLGRVREKKEERLEAGATRRRADCHKHFLFSPSNILLGQIYILTNP